MKMKGKIIIDIDIKDKSIDDAVEEIVTAIEQAGYDDIFTVREEETKPLTPTADEKEILKSICKEIDGLKHYGDLDERLIPGIEVVEEIIRLKGYDYLEHLKEEYTPPQKSLCNNCTHKPDTICPVERNTDTAAERVTECLKYSPPQKEQQAKKYWQHEETGRCCYSENPGKGYFEISKETYYAHEEKSEQKPIEWEKMRIKGSTIIPSMAVFAKVSNNNADGIQLAHDKIDTVNKRELANFEITCSMVNRLHKQNADKIAELEEENLTLTNRISGLRGHWQHHENRLQKIEKRLKEKEQPE